MRGAWVGAAVGVVAVAVGVAGLARGEVPQSSGRSATSTVSGAPVVVTDAYVHAPVPPNTSAAAYFTVHNRTGHADRLVSVATGAGASAQLHTDGAGGTMAAMSDGAVIPAHGVLRLHTGGMHVMIENVYGTLRVGQRVDIELQFQDAGIVDVVAEVVPLTAAAPTTTTGGHP